MVIVSSFLKCILTKKQVGDIARYVIGEFVGRPPTYIDVHNRYYSNAEAFDALFNALKLYAQSGKLPERVTVQPRFGPFGLQEELESARRGRGPLMPEDILTAVKKTWYGEFIPYLIPVKDGAMNTAEFYYAMAYLYRDILEELGPRTVSSAAGYILPLSAETEEEAWPLMREKVGRSKWYDMLQHWSVKPAKFKPEYQ